MACDCFTDCACVVEGDEATCVTVTGDGTSGSPYKIVIDATCTESVFAATSADNSVTITPGGVNGHTPDLAVNLSADPNQAITLEPDGILVDGSTIITDLTPAFRRSFYGV